MTGNMKNIDITREISSDIPNIYDTPDLHHTYALSDAMYLSYTPCIPEGNH